MLSAVGYCYLKQVRFSEFPLKGSNNFGTYRAIFNVEVYYLCSSKISAVLPLCALSLQKSFLTERSFLKVSYLLFQVPQFMGPMPKAALQLMLCSLDLTFSL